MRYRKPFTPEQRRDAAVKYRSWLTNARTLRAKFAPRNANERNVLWDYRVQIREFGREVAKPLQSIDPHVLNSLELNLHSTLASYFRLRLDREE